MIFRVFRLLSAAFLLLFLGSAPLLAQQGKGGFPLLTGGNPPLAGEGLWVGFEPPLAGEVQFYTFWPNGGEAPEITWALPEGFRAGQTLWPEFQNFGTGAAPVFGFAPGAVVWQWIEVPEAWDGGAFGVRADLGYFACAADCREVHDTARLTFDPDSPPGAMAVPDYEPRYTQKDLAIHANAGTDGALTFAVNFRHEDRTGEVAAVYFLSATPGLFPAGAGVFELERSKAVFYEDAFRGYISSTPINKGMEALEAVSGIVLFVMADGAIEVLPTAEPNDYHLIPAAPAASRLSFFAALAFAFFGGIILNVMPCVLPVLALKVFSFMKSGGMSAGERRADGAAYTAGILLSFAALGGLLMGLRAVFGDFAWGFQLQQPAFVFAIALVLVLIGLNFLGVFEVSAGPLSGLGQKLSDKKGKTGAFSTGVLATIVATPCTAPFMGAALAFALAQPAGLGMVIFLGLGAGLAFPYLLLSFVPGLGKFLPKPGPWMLKFKQFLAFPIFATVVWLVWILSFQSGARGVLTVLSGALLVALAAWLFGAFKKPLVKKGLAGALVILALIPLGSQKDFLPRAEGTAKLEASRIELIEYDEGELERLRAEGTPVFLHFWAAWCPICIMHEEYVFLTDEFQDFVEGEGIVFMYIDNTNYTPRNTRLMESFGRSGQPIDVFFPPGREAVVLPSLFNTEYLLARLEEELAGS